MSVCGEGEEKKPLRNKSEITHNNEGFIIVSVLATLSNYIKTLQKNRIFCFFVFAQATEQNKENLRKKHRGQLLDRSTELN